MTPVEPSRKRNVINESKVNKLEENSKNKNIWEMCKGINEFKKGYQPCPYVIKKDHGTIVADTTRIFK